MALTRRSFLVSSTASAAALALWPGRLAGSQASAPAQPPATGFESVRGAVGIFKGRGGTIGTLVQPDGLVVVDTQFPDTAKVCLDGLRARSSRTIDLVINTHHHGDHTGGNAIFRPAARHIVAHENSAALQRRTAEAQPSGPAQAFPDVTFAGTWSETIGPETIALRYLGPGHTNGDAVVTFERANVVHMGDLVFNRRHPFIDKPAGASIANWIVVLEQTVKAHDADTKYVFGHAGDDYPVVGARADLLAMRDYLTALIEAATAAVKAGTPRAAFTASKLPAAFAAYDPKVPPAQPDPRFGLPANLGIAYDEVTAGK